MKSIGVFILVFFVFFVSCSKDEDGSNEVNKENTAPQLESQSFTVVATASSGTIVGTVVATDIDDDELSYELISVDTPFSIDKRTGELILSDSALLAEMNKKSYEFTVGVSDGVDAVTEVIKVEVSESTNPGVPEPTNPEPTSISEAEKKRLTDLFIYMALRQSDSKPNTVIKKWDGDVKIFVTGSPTTSDRTLIKDFLVTLNGLATDSFNAYLVQDLSQATVEVYFGTYDEVNSNRPDFSLGTQRDNRGGSYAISERTSKIINKGEVWINTDLYKQSTIKHEIMHILGFGHSEDENSMMHSPSRFLELSADDEFVIKSLYSPSIKATFNEGQIRTAFVALFK